MYSSKSATWSLAPAVMSRLARIRALGRHRRLVGVDLVAEHQQRVGPRASSWPREFAAEAGQRVRVEVPVGRAWPRPVRSGTSRTRCGRGGPSPRVRMRDGGRFAVERRPGALAVEAHLVLGARCRAPGRSRRRARSGARRRSRSRSRQPSTSTSHGPVGLHPDRRVRACRRGAAAGRPADGSCRSAYPVPARSAHRGTAGRAANTQRRRCAPGLTCPGRADNAGGVRRGRRPVRRRGGAAARWPRRGRTRCAWPR